jgi:DNA-binding transcriptional LysR family regulator
LRAEAAVSATGAQARGVVKLSIGSTLASHWLMPRLGPFLRAHDHIQLEIITHPYPASVRRARPMSCCGRSTAARRT